MKGIEIKQETEIQIDLNVTSYIPDEYISDSNQKIEVYQNIALCKSEDDIQNVIDEIIDRFGNMPSELENLINIARIKYLAKELNIEKIASKKTPRLFTFGTSNVEGKLKINLSELVNKYKNKIKFSSGIKPSITLEINSNNDSELLKDVIEFLKSCQKGPSPLTTH